ncbi:hypothetical protein E0W68_02525 [Flavobacterium salilacus subsp. salilacus]|uniref:hypothetical protein n=1 Tax=Flavobacterium TaxID=237 RepID=UPI00107553F3|nr:MULTISPECIES: hypothetical protein [Flavobacterium]KAF2520117.1 hypothetical protein E0W68_02525 [Flavobacterium salilacus subsp. salilacus]MBE1613967.1 hypothetical protein [Flavobacterium sp. SaA2.13]
MKKILLTAICLASFSAFAQETDAVTTESGEPIRKGFYISFGVGTMNDYNINDKLVASGMPQLPDAMFEVGIGYNLTWEKILLDTEFHTDYFDKKTSTDRVRGVVAGVTLRPQYIPFRSNGFYIGTGADISYTTNTFDLYTRGNEIDLNNLDPAFHSGHISLSNQQLFMGPSVSVAAFQNSEFPLKLNVGYQWAVVSGSWDSEVADVTNTVKENGQGRFYAKLTFLL